MKALRQILFVWFLLASIACQQALAQDIRVGFEQDTTDVCASNKRSLIVLFAEGIQLQDSILGYDNLELSYDPEKFAFHTAVKSGTISEAFEFIEFDFSEPGKIYGGGGNVQNIFIQATERRPFIVFLGEYKGDCPTEETIQLNYVEFKKVLPDGINLEDVVPTMEQLPGTIQVVVREKEDRVLQIQSLEQGDIDLTYEAEREIPIHLENGKNKNLTSLEFELELSSTENIELKDVVSTNSQVIIEEVEVLEPGRRLKVIATIKNDADIETYFASVVVEQINNAESTANLVLRPVQVSTCACLTDLPESSVVLKSNFKNTSFVETQENEVAKSLVVQKYPKAWSLYMKDQSQIQTITVVDLLGRVVYQSKVDSDKAKIGIRNWMSGLYVIKVRTANKIYIKKVLI